ncbi:MAG: hypothetical protein NT098_02640 [Candidatus Parcubacteria bacterium]|nr:hypothetical protein [Candidatus Parcubacteria bacterium]
MKKILAVLVLALLGVSACQQTGQTETMTQSKILVSERVSFGYVAEGTYIKDTNATPPLCYLLTGNSYAAGSSVVPCENLKYYFGDK